MTCSAAAKNAKWLLLLLAGLALAAITACASDGASPGTGHSLADLTNPALGPDYAQWLIGPVSFLATKEEVQTYLSLKDDRAAQDFVTQFWARRNPGNRPQNALYDAVEARGAEADRLYSEAGFQGRKTDRGTIYVVYGPPKKVDFEMPRVSGGAPLEVWTYGTDASPGLNGRKPSPLYRFRKQGDLTVFYLSGPSDALRRGLHAPPGPPPD